MTTASFTQAEMSTSTQRALLGRLWVSSALVAGLSTAILWNANPGINWLLCVVAASIALLASAFAEGTGSRVAPPLVLAVLTAVGVVFAASEPLHVLSILAGLILLAIAIARANPERYARARIIELVALPAVVFVTCVAEATRRATETVRELTNDRAVPFIRGAVLTLPIAGLFALLLSSVDPTLATWRDELERLLSTWHFVPRLIFFGVVLALSLGAVGYAARPSTGSARAPADPRQFVQLGETERLMVLSAIAGVFTLFLTLQVSYLFGDVARVQGSGVSYAEWARRGFGELTIVATLCAGVIMGLALLAPATTRRRRILIVELIVLGETQVLLHSAFRRVLLYEDAYGFTTTRLYAQAYMLVVAASLILLAHELLRRPSARRLLGRAGALAVMAMAGVSIWNHESWIVRQNVARHAETGKLDLRYLACDLSARAVPEVLQAANREHEGLRARAHTAIGERFMWVMDDAWYEWNAGRSRARDAIGKAGIVGPGPDTATGICSREWS
ncbi:MAG TPA: DUF4173 domain-containing protein [Gemmatimonadaceae bacterium]|nr:DUF4173 domain-containing protein [Gemmatimonadaceae bacterium]